MFEFLVYGKKVAHLVEDMFRNLVNILVDVVIRVIEGDSDNFVVVDVWNGEKSFIPQYAKFTNVITMAGAGTDTAIRDIERLVDTYHIPAEEWKKQAAKVTSDKYIFDLHWYEADDGLQREIKLKNRTERKK